MKSIKLTLFILFIVTNFLFSADTFAGTGLEFDGTDDYVDLGTSSSLKPVSALTVEMWVNSDWTVTTSQRYICNTQTGGYNIGCDGTELTATARLNGTYRTVSFPKSEISEGNHHFALTCDGRYVKLYMDGDLKGINDAGAVYPIEYNAVNSTLLGAEVDGLSNPTGQYFDGRIDEVRVWSVARTDSLIRTSMYGSYLGAETGLVSYWQFNESTGNIITDAKVVNNGTMFNMDDSDRVSSTFPFGPGPSETQIVSSTGVVWWDYACFYMDFTEKTGTDTIVVKMLNNAVGQPNITPGDEYETLNENFWVVNKYGSGTFKGTLDVNVNYDITYEDKNRPERIRLFGRPSCSEGEWTLYTAAVDVDDESDKIYFNEISNFGQLIAARKLADVSNFSATALEFDGIDDTVNLGNIPEFNNFGPFTIEMWIKASDITTDKQILSKGDINFLSLDSDCEDIEGAGYEIYLPGTSSGWWEFRVPVTADEWNHVAWTYEYGVVKAYFNGVVVRTNTLSPYQINSNTDSLMIASSGVLSPFAGVIDELKITNRKKTEQEIREYMHIPLKNDESSMVAYWQFNEVSGTEIRDSYYDHHGTMINMDESDRINSTIPLDAGTSVSQTFTGTGMIDFAGTEFRMTVYNPLLEDSLTVTKIDTLPNILPDNVILFHSSYWEVYDFGGQITDCDMVFCNLPYLTEENSSDLNTVKLYRRASNSDGQWTLHASASSVSINGVLNEVIFENISDFGQFMVCSKDFPVISVNPVSFSETLPMLRHYEADLIISNEGLSELEYSITQSASLTEAMSFVKDHGGQDDFSYTWADSDDPGRPVYSWKDISALGTEIITNGDYTFSNYEGDPEYYLDDCYKILPLPFAFPFYGEFADSVKVSSNGHLLTGDWHLSDYAIQTMPDSSGINGVIAPFWTDLDLTMGGHVYYYHDASDSSFTVQYNDVHKIDCADTTYTFQVTLFESGRIKFQYKDIQDNLSYYAVGIENGEGTQGLMIADSSPYLKDEMAIELQPWLSLDKYSGTISGETADTLKVRFDTFNANTGSYSNNIIIQNNDTSNPEIIIPVQITVPGPQMSITVPEFDESMQKDQTKIKQISITNTGYGYLSYSFVQTDTFPEAKSSSLPIRLKREKPALKTLAAVKGIGLPDDFGYSWIDSKEIDGVDFEWNGISLVGTEVITNGDYTFTEYPDDQEYMYDDCYKSVSLPFTFRFYNREYNKVKISSNGHLLFEDWDSGNYSPQLMPDTAKVNGVIAPFWSDLNPTGYGNIYYYFNAVKNCFIVEYKNVIEIDVPEKTFTFQAVLYPDGRIRMNYLDIEDNYIYYTAGIESGSGLQGLVIADKTPFLKNGMSIELRPWLFLDSYLGAIGEGETKLINVKFDTNIIQSGAYT
ncbi:TPA: hypothetical protein DCR49_10530, partial [Candidatus Delongbacteria bacterium]|nr:hypothetical protein [Candidatus Delongbacteria bacterium]